MKIGTKEDSTNRYYEFLCELYYNGCQNLGKLSKEMNVATSTGTVVRGLDLVDGVRGQNFWISEEEPTWQLADFVRQTVQEYSSARV